MSELKVYYASVGFNNQLVAAESKAEAMRITGVTRNEFALYWGETGNEAHIEMALKYPKQLLVSKNAQYGNPWYLSEHTTSRPYDDPEKEPVK